MEFMEGWWRNLDHAWAVTLPQTWRSKDVSSCSDPIPSSKPLSVILSQRITLSSVRLKHISNMIRQQTQNNSLSIAALLAYWQCSVLLFWKHNIYSTVRKMDKFICNELQLLFQANKTTITPKAITTFYILPTHRVFIFKSMLYQLHSWTEWLNYKNFILFSLPGYLINVCLWIMIGRDSELLSCMVP